MRPEDVLAHQPLKLDQATRERYFEDGYLALPGQVGEPWLSRLRAVAAEKVEESRALTESDDQFDLAPSHGPETPRVRRLRKAVDQHPDLWAFATDPAVVDLVADLVGPDVRFHSSKLNYKWSGGGEAVHWHQDIQAWPHTNFSPLTFGVYLEDTGSEQGPLAVIPGSHRGPLFEQFDAAGNWTGMLGADALERVGLDRAVELCGPAGTVVILNCRVVHGSQPNHSARSRPLFLNVYSAADALALLPAPAPTTHTGEIVRGAEATRVHMEPFDARLPPRWDKVGYGSIFTAQGAKATAHRA